MASQRLNNDIREAFINSVMADVPKVDYSQKIRDAVNKAARDALPPQVKKLLSDEALAKFVNVEHCHLDERSGLPRGEYLSFRLPAGDYSELHELAIKVSEDFAKPWVAQENCHNELRKKLRSVAYHCATRKQLAEAFPEFEKYLPSDESEATRNLPALANVVNDFVKAGWPKKEKA